MEASLHSSNTAAMLIYASVFYLGSSTNFSTTTTHGPKLALKIVYSLTLGQLGFLAPISQVDLRVLSHCLQLRLLLIHFF
jgi:hypothetical protein